MIASGSLALLVALGANARTPEPNQLAKLKAYN